jgi:DNA-binding response OmpR family regulator
MIRLYLDLPFGKRLSMSETYKSLTGLEAQLLVVDDEPHLRISMQELLRRRGYQVEAAGSGAEALSLLECAPFDLMVLDLHMPGMSGVEVMRRARQIRPDLSIIVLTAHASVDSAIAAVKHDVTDYLLKPCSVDDLILTIARALQERTRQVQRDRLLNMMSEAMDVLRQADSTAAVTPAPAPATSPLVSLAPEPAQSHLRVGPLTLDRHKRLVFLSSDPSRIVELTENEVAILVAMMEHPNQVFSCKQLADKALGYDGLDKWTVESMIRSSIFRLRQKIQGKPEAPPLIRTVRGRGYYFSPV